MDIDVGYLVDLMVDHLLANIITSMLYIFIICDIVYIFRDY